MGFFRRLFGMGPAKVDSRYFPFYVYSQRCNEPLAGKIDTMNELSISEDADAAWYSRKVVHSSGRARCFDQIEVEVWFDANKAPVRRNVTGGLWLEADEYDRLVKAQASTLVDDAPGAAAATAPSAPAGGNEPAQNSIQDSTEMPGGNQNIG
jgi:hypothetical protein